MTKIPTTLKKNIKWLVDTRAMGETNVVRWRDVTRISWSTSLPHWNSRCFDGILLQ